VSDTTGAAQGTNARRKKIIITALYIQFCTIIAFCKKISGIITCYSLKSIFWNIFIAITFACTKVNR